MRFWNKLPAFYDYLELQPVGNNEFLICEGIAENLESIQLLNKKVYELGKRLNKPVVATGDVHFLIRNIKYFAKLYRQDRAMMTLMSRRPFSLELLMKC